jgi:hypothetical protein
VKIVHFIDGSSFEQFLRDVKRVAPLVDTIDALRGIKDGLLIIHGLNDLQLFDLLPYLPLDHNVRVLLTGSDQGLRKLASPGQSLKLSDEDDEAVSGTLKQWLLEPLNGKKVVTMVAKGGTGKTQIAAKYASHNKTTSVSFLFPQGAALLTTSF